MAVNRDRLEEFMRERCQVYSNALIEDVLKFRKQHCDHPLHDSDSVENDNSTELGERIADVIHKVFDADKILRLMNESGANEEDHADKPIEDESLKKLANKEKKKKVKTLNDKGRLRKEQYQKHKSMMKLFNGSLFTGFLLCTRCNDIMGFGGGSVVRHIRQTCKALSRSANPKERKSGRARKSKLEETHVSSISGNEERKSGRAGKSKLEETHVSSISGNEERKSGRARKSKLEETHVSSISGNEFDGKEEVKDIEKVSALYDVSKDERRRRLQFPVTVAFAATIHKCQGMTVKNAVISLASCFSAGQAFVALSRVQNIEGLHLLDLDERKITVDRLSLKEYNRLRSLIKLPPFAIPEKKVMPRIAAKEKSKRKTATKRHSDAKISYEFVSPYKKETPETARRTPPRTVAIPTHPELGFVAIENQGSDCFLISAINLLNIMPEVVQILGNFNDNTAGAVYFLARLIQGSMSRVRQLRAFLRNVAAAGQQDVNEGFFDLFEYAIPDVLAELFQFTVRKRSMCAACGLIDEVNDGHPRPALVVAPKENEGRQTLNGLWERWNREEGRACKRCFANRSTRVKEPVFSDGAKYMFVSLQRRRHIPVYGVDRDGFEFAGERYILKGAVEYLPGGENEEGRTNGHYVTWVRREEGGYYVIDDDKDLTMRNQLPAGLKGLSLLLLERKERVRQARKSTQPSQRPPEIPRLLPEEVIEID